MDARKLHILRHSLGLTNSRQAYRNHFVTGPGSTDFPDCEALVAEGFMERHGPSELSGGDYCYVVTEAGRAALPQNGVGS